MKKINQLVMQQTKTTHPISSIIKFQNISFFSLILLITILFIGCTKDVINETSETAVASKASKQMLAQVDPLGQYSGLDKVTAWELQQARAATAKYKQLKNAEKDGYVDIDVIMPNMGYHYMKMENVDDQFDIRNPEILVYNHDEDGNMELVAVEYAIPIPLSVNAPEGFTGMDDEWNYHTGFGLWLLHAWVWKYNPDGVFNATNPDVHVQ